MYRVLLVVLLIAFVGVCSAQLNFTPNWGKRTSSPAAGESDNCKESVDTIMLIYKIIQNEAQKLVECEKFSN
ncbi:Adipokin hormo domain containing protein [Asbolus verrucosus]|uniref:Adipokin hormo domain containing protein n=1 Tax=Asbolus verrucosus TaxID=1661398 RepID=A0A482VD49_ASBVE|nr:Adipokin hormo domain containing protein [Asbolus verrucosus]